MACYREGCNLWCHSPRSNSTEIPFGTMQAQGTFRTVCTWKKLQEKIRAVDFSEYKDKCKANLKEIGVDDESSDSEADFENDFGPSKKTRVVIIENDEEDY